MKIKISHLPETSVIIFHITPRHIREFNNLSSAKDVLNAPAQDFVANEELLLLRSLQSFSQNTRSRLASQNASCFQSVQNGVSLLPIAVQ